MSNQMSHQLNIGIRNKTRKSLAFYGCSALLLSLGLYLLLHPRLTWYTPDNNPARIRGVMLWQDGPSLSAPGRRNGHVPTSSPPLGLSLDGIRERFLRAADTVGFSRSGAERLLDIAGIARGSSSPRTTSEPDMSSGLDGGTEASIR